MIPRLCRVTAWAVGAFFAQRFKQHGKAQSSRTSLMLALMGWHIGMRCIGAWTDPAYWLMRRKT